MMLFISFILSLLSIVTLPNNSTIEKVQNKFTMLKNFQADFVQFADGKTGLKGKFYFGKENNYRIELQNNIIISDGNTIWNYDKKRNRVVVSALEDDPLSFSLREYIFNYPEKCNVSEEKSLSGNSVVILKAKDATLNFKEANLFITDNFLVKKIVVKDFNGGSFSFKFSNIEIDKNLKPKLFKFNNTTGAKIIDLR